MRISDQMTYSRGKSDVGTARSRLDQATATASSGARVVHPGDDPAAAGLVTAEKIRQERMDALATTTARASDEIYASDVALGDIANALSRASEIAVQLSSTPYTPTDRAAGAKEVQGLIATVLGDLNTKVGNRYIFGGSQDASQPFDDLVLDVAGNVDAANTGIYRGDARVRQVEIAPGVLQDTSVRADVALRGAGGGTDVIATLSTLANALAANNPTTVAATLAGLSQSITQISTARNQTGAIMNTLDAATAANKSAKTDAQKRISGLAEADEIEAASTLAAAQHALDASLTAVAKSFQFTLIGKL